jgi:ketosteroid isomerase-like protein
VLEEYGQALQAGDLTALRRLWPGLPDRRAQDLQTFFDNTGDRRVRLTVEDIVPSGDAARAAISIRFEFNGGRQNHEENATVALARSGQGWYITGVR